MDAGQITASPTTALAAIDADALIDRISDGAFLRDLSKETGIDKRRLSERLRKHPAYQSAKETSIEVQLDDAQLALQLARETADIARAREMFRAAAWRAEREFPHRWGAKTQVSGDLSITVQIARGVTYEGEKPNEISEAIPAGSDITTQESGVSD
jgi:hypothetical protein